MYRSKTIFTTLLLALPMAAFAHEGHGVFQAGQLSHYLASPMHAIPAAIVLALTIILVIKWQGEKKKA